MKSLSLFGVLLLARLLALLGREVPLSPWSPIAYLWQDLLVALLFAGLERITARQPWISWTVYFAAVIYIALNLPLLRLMWSPITLPMLRATRGALADSIRHHLTLENLLVMTPVLGLAVALPWRLRRAHLRRRTLAGMGMASLAVIASGPFATSRVETNGLHRNVFFALLQTAIPRVATRAAESSDWRKSPAASADSLSRQSREELSRFKGAAQGRNVVVILLESIGAAYLKPYGAAEDPMPHLTALADRAILFENAYAVCPESIKGLFSVLCSRYPSLDTEAEVSARVMTPAIASRLAAAGYRTGLFHSGRFAYLGMEEVVRHRGFQTLEDAGDIGGNYQSSFGVDDAMTARRMLGWIDAASRGKKFFITYLPVAGHHPYDAPAPGPFRGNDEMGRYRNALHYSDAVLGEFLDGLKSRGLFEKTLFVIFGDHGEAFGQHEGNYGHTLFVYDENVHVPYLIVAPGLISEQIRVNRVASLLDTAPTVLDLLGLDHADEPTCSGTAGRRTALARARADSGGDCTARQRRGDRRSMGGEDGCFVTHGRDGSATTEYQGSSLLEPTHRLALFYADYSLGLLGLRDGRWKFIYELESGRSKLFDLVTDRTETKNLAETHLEQVKAYRDHLRNWAAAQRASVLPLYSVLSE
jgi:arylsulfatase A-like enzyme